MKLSEIIYRILTIYDKLFQITIASLRYGSYDYVEKNDFSQNRVVGLVKRISKFNQLIEE